MYLSLSHITGKFFLKLGENYELDLTNVEGKWKLKVDGNSE